MIANLERFKLKNLKNITLLWRRLNSAMKESKMCVFQSTVSAQKAHIGVSVVVKSTSLVNDIEATRTEKTGQEELDDPAYRKVDLKFENAVEAYRSKRNYELLRAYAVFQLCSSNYIVDHNKQVYRLR